MKNHLVVTPGSRSIVGYSLDDPIALVNRRGLDEESPLGRSIRDPPDRINSVEEACVGEASYHRRGVVLGPLALDSLGEALWERPVGSPLARFSSW